MTAKQVQEFKETEIGKIPADWKLEKLQDHLIIKGRIGWKGLKKSEFSKSENCIIVNGPDIKNGKINWDSCLRIPKWRYDESPDIMLKNKDILMTKDGTIGKTCFLNDLTENATVASGIFVIRNNSKNLLQNFLYVYLNSFYFKNLVNSRIEGSVIPHLYQRDLTQLLIPLPTLSEQKKICAYIENLNSNIENLQNQNHILEQTAQAIFQSWFVNFDGVTEFEDSELGKIPKGWSVEKMTEIIEVNPKRKLEKNLFSPFLSMTNIPVHSSRISNFYYRNFTSGTKFENGDTLLARITPSLENGKTAFVDFLQEDEIGWGSTEFIVLRPKAPFPPEYGYCLCRTDELRLHAIANMTGTSGRQRVQESCFDDYKIVKPSLDIIQNFSVISKNIFLKIKENGEAISSLTKTRDALLPKLMSGEIRV